MKKVKPWLFSVAVALLGLVFFSVFAEPASAHLEDLPRQGTLYNVGDDAEDFHLYVPSKKDTNYNSSQSGECTIIKATGYKHLSDSGNHDENKKDVKDLEDPGCFENFDCYNFSIAFSVSRDQGGQHSRHGRMIISYKKTPKTPLSDDCRKVVPDGVCRAVETKSFLGIPAWNRGLPDQEDADCVDILQPPNPDGSPRGPDALVNKNHIEILIVNATNIAISLSGFIAVAMIIYGGFRFVLSQGSSDQTGAAMKIVTNAVVGLVIVILGKTVIEIIHNRLDVGLRTVDDLQSISPAATLTNIIGLVFLALGACCVVICALQGLKYAASGGNSKKTGEALNGLIYAAVGMIVAVGSWAIVNFVIDRMVFGDETPNVDQLTSRVLGVIIFIVAAVAVFSMIIGAFNFVYSGGDSKRATEARNKLVYGLIGLLVAIAAAPLTMWVLSQL